MHKFLLRFFLSACPIYFVELNEIIGLLYYELCLSCDFMSFLVYMGTTPIAVLPIVALDVLSGLLTAWALRADRRKREGGIHAA